MGRKNKRKRREYRDRLGFNPWKYVERPGVSDRDRGTYHAMHPDSQRQPMRGDIWFAELGSHPGTSVQAGCRPVFIVSNDIGNRCADTVNVLPMTRHLKRQSLPCHTKLDPEKVLDMRQPLEPSMILAEQVTTISKWALRNYAGHVSDDDLMERIDLAVRLQLGLEKEADGGSQTADLAAGGKPAVDDFSTEEKGVRV